MRESIRNTRLGQDEKLTKLSAKKHDEIESARGARGVKDTVSARPSIVARDAVWRRVTHSGLPVLTCHSDMAHFASGGASSAGQGE